MDTVVKAGKYILHSGKIAGVSAEYFPACYGVGEQIGYELATVDSRCAAATAILRRPAFRKHEFARTVADEALFPKAAGIFHYRYYTRQIFVVKGVDVVLPQVVAEPGVGLRILRVEFHLMAEYVIGVAECPCSAVAAGSACGCKFAPFGTLRHVDDVIEECHVGVAQSGTFGRPIVHLNVHISMDVAVPLVVCTPYPFKEVWKHVVLTG